MQQTELSGEFKAVHEDPFHAASAVIGAAVFYVSALAPLLPNATFNPLAPEQVAAHERDALRTVRVLLGISSPDSVPAHAPVARRRRRKKPQSAASTRRRGGTSRK